MGLYRKRFTVDESLRAANGRIYINFQGVEAADYVYLNGKPDTSGKPDTPDKSEGGVPAQTGDTTNVVVWIVLAGGCAMALIGALIVAKKASRSTT